MKKRVLLAGSSEVSICNFRKELVERLLDEDFEVIVSSPYGSKFDELIAKGCIFEDTPMNRRSKDIFKDVSLFITYLKILREHKPDLIITYTIKPNLYACLAAMMMHIPYIMNITGLGTEIERDGLTGHILLDALKPLLRKSDCVFFQNIVHINLFKQKGLIKDNYKLVAGSGVNLKEHRQMEYPDDDEIEFLYVGRLMPEKGIAELIEATELAQKENGKIRVTALGFCEKAYKEHFENYNKDKIIKHMEYTADVDSVIRRCSAVINASYHEGMSNALLEGAACGRPLLASDIPGCREIVDDGKNGFLFKSKDARDIAEKMLAFSRLSYEERRAMGDESRKKVEREFDRDDVVNEIMQEIYRILDISAANDKEDAYA